MNSDATSMRAADPPVRPEETLLVALLLAVAAGYLDTYTWIEHGVLANAQTANLIFLWVNATAGRWQQAFHFVPSLAAFCVGVVIAAWLRRVAGDRTARISLIIEIAMLIFVSIIHRRLPAVAGTLGISMVAAMQTSIFTRVEGSVYSSVMITGNFRQAIEGAFAVITGDPQAGPIRKSCVFMAVCAAFGTGAATGAFITERVADHALVVPAAVLLIVLWRCRPRRGGGETA